MLNDLDWVMNSCTKCFETIDRIKPFPEAWQPFYKGTRRCQVRRFPYGVIYKQVDDLLLIFAVANLHRKPDYWADRMS